MASENKIRKIAERNSPFRVVYISPKCIYRIIPKLATNISRLSIAREGERVEAVLVEVFAEEFEVIGRVFLFVDYHGQQGEHFSTVNVARW